MSLEQEIIELKEKVAYYERIIKTISTPIIPSIVPKTILIPIAGYMFRERFDNIQTKTLEYIGEHKEIEQAVFDFSGVNVEDLEAFDYNELAMSITSLNSSLRLMGIRPIYVGFNPQFIREIVHASIQVDIETYKSFREALKKLLAESKKSIGDK
ncbi:STAS domain-containing protein [Psychrobacillus antarcticus]|uniref:STAS domain-containing protein n=1 Tax=Psychrobacillus antarcticus TaxID=2879115 RepID=UPI002407C7FF|nr:STAS domain-containing protein [Psychrobacillus antarcticus]